MPLTTSSAAALRPDGARAGHALGRLGARLLVIGALIQTACTPHLLSVSPAVAVVGLLAAVAGCAAGLPGLVDGGRRGLAHGPAAAAVLLLVHTWALDGGASGRDLLLHVTGLAAAVGCLAAAGWAAAARRSVRWAPAFTAGVVVGGLLAPLPALAWTGGGGTTCANSGCTTPFAVALPIPATLVPTSTDATTDYYTLTEKQVNLSVVPGKTTPMWTYNGTWPGPTIRTTAGRQVKVHVVNSLATGTTTHLHGAHVLPSSDGGPVDLVPPGGSRDYVYPNTGESARTQWYHDHTKDQTGKNVYMGLAGMYLIADSQEQALNLPSGAYDVPLVLQDRTFNADGTLRYAPSSSDLRDGFQGDTLFVNGAAQPYVKVSARRYRFRVLNGSNGRYYTFSLSNGAAMTQVANEAGLLSKPYPQTSITLAPAERADVVVDFSGVAPGTSVTLKNGSGWTGATDIMRFDVGSAVADTSGVPSTLRPFTPLAAASVSARRTFTIEQTNGMWTFNRQMYDPSRIDASVALGATEEWTFDNRSGQDHPIHLHDINFQVVAGGATTGPASEWKETVDVPRWSSVTVRVRFPDYTGTYVFHCHILEHEDAMLMGQFKVG